MNGTYLALVTVAAATLVGARTKRRLGSRTLYMDYFEKNPSIRPASKRSAGMTFEFPWPEQWGIVRVEVENVPLHWDHTQLERWVRKELIEDYWDEAVDHPGRYATEEMRAEMADPGGEHLFQAAMEIDPATLEASDWDLDE